MTQGHCGRCGEHYEACSCERGPRDINVAQVGVLERMSSELRRAQEMLSLAELRVREDQARIARLEGALREIAQFSTHTDRDDLTWIGAGALDIARDALDAKEGG